MRKRKPYEHRAGPKVTNELRQTQDCEYSRPRRRNDLKYVGYWGDIYHRETKNWKDRRVKQYREEKRGQQHELVFETSNWSQQWNVECYLKKHDIPYRVEEIRHIEKRKHVIRTKRVKDYQVPNYVYTWKYLERPDGTKYLVRVVKHLSGYSWKYREEPLDKPKVRYYNVSVRDGWRLVWWSDKDIGIEYILKRTEW